MEPIKYSIILSVNSDILISSLPICSPLTSFCCLIALVRPSSTILNTYGERGQICLFPDFSGIASIFSPFRLILATDLLDFAFTIFKYGFGILIFSRLLA